MLTWLRNWWIFRDVTGDLDLGAAGDEAYVLVHTGKWFKGCVCVTVPRDELRLLAEMINDSEGGGTSTEDNTDAPELSGDVKLVRDDLDDHLAEEQRDPAFAVAYQWVELRARMDRMFAELEAGTANLADVPDAPEPGRYVPAPGEWWRTGTSEGTDELTLYRHTAAGPKRGRLVGMMRDPADAALVVEAVNAELPLRQYGATMGSTDPGGAPYPQLVAVYRDAEAMLAGRNAGQPDLLHQELRRMRGELDAAIEAVETTAGEGRESG